MNRELNDKILLVSSDAQLESFLMRILSADTGLFLESASLDQGDIGPRIAALNPDVVLFYIDEDPGLVLTRVSRIMLNNPYPIIILASDTENLKGMALKCLELGAVDMFMVPGDFESASREHRKRLSRILDSARRVRMKKMTVDDMIDTLKTKNDNDVIHSRQREALVAEFSGARLYDAVGIAVSTGGPRTLTRFLPTLPGNMPTPVFVVQHIINGFIHSVAERLNEICPMFVKVAEDGEDARGGVIYFAPDDIHIRLVKGEETGQVIIKLSPEPADSLFRPSADVLFESLAEAYGRRSIAVMMTGMGRDGVKGLEAIKRAGGIALAQDRDTSVIFGMAQVAIEKNLVDQVLPLPELGDGLLRTILSGYEN